VSDYQERTVPNCRTRCRYIDRGGNEFPCSECERQQRRDYYESETEFHRKARKADPEIIKQKQTPKCPKCGKLTSSLKSQICSDCVPKVIADLRRRIAELELIEEAH